ncbi:L-asparagine transporter [Daejeonella lutea]|uniref:L-asparagine transporter n=2 Tax=Daejeonella lutea TaxID=572036 RepID=A0A1T5ASR4_9SPHI|nr:L-asparagine transporter [Daejeonella lutea]
MAQKLKRTLSLAECIFFGVGSILGAGIYTIVGKVAGFAGNMTWLAFLVASLTALLTAFSYAELSAVYPKAGGEYVYTKKAMGEKIGTGVGFIIALNGIISGATVAVGFGGYLVKLVDTPIVIAALGIIALIFLVNLSGIRESSIINIIFTLIEFSGLVLVIIAAFPKIGSVNLLEGAESGKASVLMAASLGFFAFIGFEEIVKLAEETKNPQKTIPRALFVASAIVTIMYFIVAVSAVSALPVEKLAASSSPLSDIAEDGLGTTAGLIIIIIALFSTSNTILSNMLGSSRVIYDMAKEVKIMGVFQRVSKRQTPYAALILILVVMSAFALIGKIEVIAMIANLFIFITFFTINLSVILLRQSDPQKVRPFKIPLNVNNMPIISFLGMAMTLLLFGFNVYILIS